MSDSDSDEVFETTAHGSQTVRIKKENDEENDVCDQEKIWSDTTLHNNLTWTPLVYTTRLDQMYTLGNIEKYDTKEASLLIEIESKPKYKQILPVNCEPHNSDTESYQILCNRIHMLNDKAKFEEQRNKELMKMCKPLKIVLTDLNSDFDNTKRKPRGTSSRRQKDNTKKKNSQTYDSETDSADDIPLAIIKKPILNAKNIVPGSTILQFKDNLSQNIDVYILNAAKDIRYFIKSNSYELSSLKQRYTTENDVIFNICCWVKRELSVKKLVLSGIVDPRLTSFMRKQHTCSTSLCKCCCVFKNPIAIQSSVTLKKYIKSNLSTATPQSKLLQKAYSYVSSTDNNVIKEKDEQINYLKNAVILIKFTDIFCSITGHSGETFEIDGTGNIFNHVKLKENRSLLEERELLERSDRQKLITRQYLSYLICCWYKREEIVGNIKNLTRRNLHYLRNRHLCRYEFCKCCCLPSTRGLQTDTTCDEVQGLKTWRRNKNQQTEQNIIRNETSAKTSGTPRKIDNKELKDPVEVVECINLEEKATSDSNKNDENSPSFLDESVVGIYNRLKELTLSVSHQGKLTANISTPPDKLQTYEVRVLGDILNLASKQMKELGLTPEEFCHRVNSRKLAFISNNEIPNSSKSNTTNSKLPLTVHPKLDPPPLRPIQTNTKQTQKKIPFNKLRSCKATIINLAFPKTRNIGRKCLLYQTLAKAGMMRNQSFVNLYKMEFKINDNKPKSNEIVTKNKMKEKTTVSKTRPKKRYSSSHRNTLLADIPSIKPKPTGPAYSTEMAILTKNVANPEEPQPGPSKPTTIRHVNKSNPNINESHKVPKPSQPSPGPSQPLLIGNINGFPLIQNNNDPKIAGPIPVQNVNKSNVLSLQNMLNTNLPPNIAQPMNGNIYVYLNGALIPMRTTVVQPNVPQTELTANVQSPLLKTVPMSIGQTPILTVNNGVLMPTLTHITKNNEEIANEPKSASQDLTRPDAQKKWKSKPQKRTVTSMILEHSQIPAAKKPRPVAKKPRPVHRRRVQPKTYKHDTPLDKILDGPVNGVIHVITDDEEDSLLGI